MNEIAPSMPSASVAAATGRRTRRAKAFSVVGALVLIAGCASASDSSSPDREGSSSGTATGGVMAEPLAMSLPDASESTRCRAPSADLLAGDYAFRATVERVDTEVLFAIDDWMHGESAAVTATLPTPTKEDAARLLVPAFIVGEEYLVTVDEGAMLICGLSGAANPELEGLYRTAYGQ